MAVLRRPLWAVLAVAATAAVALAFIAARANGANPGGNGAIAYTSSGGIPSEGYGTVTLSLWAMNPDGSAQQALHQNYIGDPLEIGPSWSPDGNRVAYTRCPAVLFGARPPGRCGCETRTARIQDS